MMSNAEQQADRERRFAAGERLCVECGEATADTYGGLCAACDVEEEQRTTQAKDTDR